MRRRSPAAGLAATVLLLGGCGGGVTSGAPTGADVATDAAEAVESAGSVHVSGAMTQAGTEQAVDLHLQGDDVSGVIATGGEELELLVTGGATYARAGADFWVACGMPPEIVPDFDGAWVLMPAEAAAEFGAVTLDGLVEQLRDTAGLEDEVRSEERNGVDVHVVEHEDGSSLVVEADRPGYPLELRRAGGLTGALSYSRFGEREDLTAPVDYVDLGEYAGA